MAVTNTTIDLEWTAATDNVGVVSYQIFQSTDNISFTQIHESDGVTLAYTAIGLTQGTKYYFKQTAKDAAGNQSTYGNTVTATTLGGVVEINWDYTKMYIGEGDNTNLVTLYFTGQDADIASIPAVTDWVLDPFNVVNTVTVYTDRVELLVNTEFDASSNATIDYTPGVNPLKDIDGHLLTALNDQPLDNLLVPSFTYILDDYPGSVAAYSVRKLISTAVDCAIIRRDSDNSETTVYLYDDPDKNIDLLSDVEAGGSLGDWVGLGNAFIHTWYDQSGQGNDITQTSGAAQPFIVSSGVMSEYGVNFYGANKYLIGANSVSFQITGDMSSFLTMRLAGNIASNQELFVKRINDNDREYEFRLETTGIRYLDSGNSKLQSYTLVSQDKYLLGFDRVENTSVIQHINGVAANENILTGTQTASSADLSIGSRLDGSTSLSGGLAELILYNSNQSANRDAIQDNINNHYNIWVVTAEVDAQLIQADNDNVSDTVIEINGVRSSASDTAVTNLISRNNTVITN